MNRSTDPRPRRASAGHVRGSGPGLRPRRG